MSEHTPGEWELIGQDICVEHRFKPELGQESQTIHQSIAVVMTTRADGQLMAAAPNMEVALEELAQEAAELLGDLHTQNWAQIQGQAGAVAKRIVNARVALAKARGGDIHLGGE